MKKVKILKITLEFGSESSSNSKSISNMSNKSSESNSYYKEYEFCNRNIVNKSRERLKKEMNIICKKYNLNYEIIRRIVDLEFDLDLHYSVKVNRMIFYHDFYRD